MTARGRKLALAACLFLVLFMIVSSALLAREASHPHECTGDRCPICLVLAQAEQTRRAFGLALLALALFALIQAARRSRHIPAAVFAPSGLTLIGLKIRLNR